MIFMPFDFHLLQKSKAEKGICSLSTDPLQKLRLQGKAGELLYPTTPLQNCLHFKVDYYARSVGAILPLNASVARAQGQSLWDWLFLWAPYWVPRVG